jgi:hypothetical protein
MDVRKSWKAISAAKAFESAGQDHLSKTGGDQDKPKVSLPKGKAISKRPQQQSASTNPAGNGYPGSQPQRPGPQPTPYADDQHRPPVSTSQHPELSIKSERAVERGLRLQGGSKYSEVTLATAEETINSCEFSFKCLSRCVSLTINR